MDSLWNKYWESRDVEARNTLVLHYDDLIQKVCRGMKRRLPPNIDIHDLHSTGVIGLISAIESFDKAKNVPFPPWGILRIRGAILDEFRALDWIPQKTRKKIKFIPQILNGFHDDIEETPAFSFNSYVDPKSNEPFERLVNRDQVKFALKVLPPRERQVVSEYHFKSKPLKKIGAIFGFKYDWAYKVYHLALDKMRRMIA